jgi:hypothetical protein
MTNYFSCSINCVLKRPILVFPYKIALESNRFCFTGSLNNAGFKIHFMKIFINKWVQNVSIVLTVVHAIALMYTPAPWSSNPRDAGFWIAVFSAVTSTILINLTFVLFAGRKRSE